MAEDVDLCWLEKTVGKRGDLCDRWDHQLVKI